MTNYTKFPQHRCHIGFTIMFNDNKYSWCDDTPNQRKYLRESHYCDGAMKVYVGKINKWFRIDEFKKYLIESNDI
ncbi:MAG: hypothetical protein SO253_01025 [Bacilli bacterium]|nr:hypothetical protein [Bacilli bacterium]